MAHGTHPRPHPYPSSCWSSRAWPSRPHTLGPRCRLAAFPPLGESHPDLPTDGVRTSTDDPSLPPLPLPGLVSTARTRLQTAMITAMSPAPRTVFGTQQVFSTCLLNDQSQGPSLPRPGRRQRLPQQPPASPPQPASALFPWAASSQLCSHAI